MDIVNGVRENGAGPVSLETGAFTAGTSSLTSTRVNKLSRKTFRHRDHRAQPYNRATPENRVCGEAGPSGITHTTRLQNSTPPHNDQDTVRSLTILERLSSIDLPEQQKPGALYNSGESEPIFISGPATSPMGPLRVEFNFSVDLELVKKENPNVQPGGRFKPKDCEALQKVAIIIAFRYREEHLKYWLHYLHPILQRQQLDYGVYVIKQDGNDTFNKCRLLNTGYAEALKEYDYNCFVFNDVDVIPMDDRNTYKCFSQPRHLAVSLDKFNFRLPYVQCFGGATSLSKEQYLKINGFPNNYWGWGGEDDDIYNRVVTSGMSISRPNSEIGKCRMIRHNRDKLNDPNPQRFNLLSHTQETMYKDGINSLKTQVLSIQKLDLFTMITVDVGKQ
ncbi:beta-1,4-galactosyltransferase 1 isoform X1 [Oreochromis niloticus]|uniref:beta-1,4-galactosyltransferase 1 isoform X1 n=1 Tax=Oreochromis niloticus TaxID=8128 RepID=UPI000904DA83|nr:beta-1,4-galactosyltransferase 1 isoform X1 [Oreochromis niloticus]